MAADFGTSRLYHNNGDGTFADVTETAHVGLDTNGMGSVLADVDNDGGLDWYVTSIWTTSPFENPPNNGNYLYRNLGGGAFDPAPRRAGRCARRLGWGVAAVDLDHDGLLELVTTNGSEDKNTDERQEWLEDATRVFHNRGAEGFRDVAPEAGLDHRGQGRGLVRFDYDNDGDQDLLIVNSRGVPTLVANTGGTATGNWLWVALRPAPRPAGAAGRRRCGGARAHGRHDADPPHRDRRRLPRILGAERPLRAGHRGGGRRTARGVAGRLRHLALRGRGQPPPADRAAGRLCDDSGGAGHCRPPCLVTVLAGRPHQQPVANFGCIRAPMHLLAAPGAMPGSTTGCQPERLERPGKARSG